jgi:DNA repair protein RadA/Sms
MARKTKSEYLCSECGETFPKWLGKCTSCGEFNTITEYRVPVTTGKRRNSGVSAGLEKSGEVQSLSDCSVSAVQRLSTGFPEIDTVLGGGIVTGSMTLLGGAPGIGKSTLILQIIANIARLENKVLYVSGEESVEQIALRAKRLNVVEESIKLLTETSVEQILTIVEKEKPKLVVIDSIQTLYAEDVSSAPGSVSQVRECTAMLMVLAKKQGISLIIIGHVTKDGSIAGPRVLEHMVDTVLNFEGDSNYSYRILRGIKNRFGPSGEIALLGMEPHGLVEMSDIARYFIHQSSLDKPGSAVVPILQGSRVLMVEVQALVTPTHFGLPQRVSAGINPKKLALIVAILERYAGIAFGDYDIFLNITGGLNVSETAVDLAIAAALLSSFRNRPIPKGTSFLGELGLSGEIRPVIDMEKRIREVATMGFKTVITSPLTRVNVTGSIKTVECREVSEFEQILN